MHLYSEKITQFEGKTVNVCIYNKIYGNQKGKIRCFQPLCKKDRIGFIYNDREIFLYSDEIESIEFMGNTVKIIGTIQEIIIELI